MEKYFETSLKTLSSKALSGATRPAETAGVAAIRADVTIEFARQTVTYKQIAFHLAAQGKHIQVKGTLAVAVNRDTPE